MLKSFLFDYSDAYITVKGTITIAQEARENQTNNDKEVVFKNCASFTYRIGEKKKQYINR